MRIEFATLSGTRYVLDRTNEDEMTATRLPDGEASDLRKDNESVRLLRWPILVPGKPAVLVLAIRDDAVTLRETTDVKWMRNLS